MALIADHDIGLPLAGDPSQAVGAHGRHALVERVELGIVRHVADVAVAERRQHHQPLRLIDLQAPVRREHGQPRHLRLPLHRSGRSLFEPEPDQLVLAAVRLHLLAATVIDVQRRLEQQETILGHRRAHATPLGALDDLRVIFLRLEAQERELEPAFTVLRPVAGPLVAAQLRQGGDDLVPEVHAPRFARTGHLNRHPPLDRPDPHHDLARSVLVRGDPPPLVTLRDRPDRLEPRLIAEVASRPVGKHPQHNETLGRRRPAESDRLRGEFQPRRLIPRAGRARSREAEPATQKQEEKPIPHGRVLCAQTRFVANSAATEPRRGALSCGRGSDPRRAEGRSAVSRSTPDHGPATPSGSGATPPLARCLNV